MKHSNLKQFLVTWNQTQTDYPRSASIQALFEFQVKKSPNAVAVTYLDQQLTYIQLNEQANQLAYHLQSLGVKRGSLVSIYLERSIKMVVCMLAILKAGGAYVPLDLNYPQQRLLFMMKDTNSRVLLTHNSLLDRFTKEIIEIIELIEVVCLDRDKDLINSHSVSNLNLEISGDDLAYVMYTSGSTGTPKGVEIVHRGVVRLIINTNYIQLSTSDRMAHLNNCSFDASTFEVWGALLSGAKLIILDQQVVMSPQKLADHLKAKGITVLLLTTPLFNLLAEESPDVLAGIENLLFGGETVDPQWVRKIMDKKKAGRLLQAYGPTENTTFTTVYEISAISEGALVPIGPPIANTCVYVLDSHMKPVPVGMPGELYIGGDGLARGYLNRPKLTAERFVDDPFCEEPHSRLYRTGDMVRWLPDGILEFLGRQDDQVKLRGFRIELGEIESVLRAHEMVKEAVVMLREDEPKNKHLVGYVVPSDKESLLLDDLRAYLKKKLPDYMVPSYFIRLESLPLTPNGKVDRKKLPSPTGNCLTQNSFVAPQTETEHKVASIWRQVLNIDKISVNENFFDLGGHSLLATQVVSRLCNNFGLEIPIISIFDFPTVADLARNIDMIIWATRGPKKKHGTMTGRKEGKI